MKKTPSKQTPSKKRKPKGTSSTPKREKTKSTSLKRADL